ncbi:hypothetical protein FOZ62_028497 [Perkinsus olseni]|uniref:Uncharacterized protein n=1 Tax=Perkinsus olseni TaxID=32597 RepID=A0A7J6TEY1_PEROL|nr:hypothetical protein FOZ62_028497 [Perkinsus olseni]
MLQMCMRKDVDSDTWSEVSNSSVGNITESVRGCDQDHDIILNKVQKTLQKVSQRVLEIEKSTEELKKCMLCCKILARARRNAVETNEGLREEL